MEPSKSSREILTPAPSESGTSAAVSEGRVTRARGAGQVALARPRTRQPPKKQVGRKRIRLDSDDEEDGDAEGEAQSTNTKNQQAGPSTPKKASAGTDSEKVKRETPSDVDLPVIVVQHPTPRRPLAPASTDISLAPTETSEGEATVDDEPVTDQTVVSENIVPSPATENDPPPFPVSPHQSLTDVSAVLQAQPESQSTTPAEVDETETDAKAVRVLRPTSTFTEITLWAPDAPLAGFRADEAQGGSSASAESADPDAKPPITEQSENEQQGSVNALKTEEDAGIKLHPGWWRVGGAGEGGDEFVRAMGEWLGLVEMVRNL